MTVKSLYSGITPSEITRLFLYGQDEIPANLTQEGMIRLRDAVVSEADRLTITVDSLQLMSDFGPGRFALPGSFDIIKNGTI